MQCSLCRGAAFLKAPFQNLKLGRRNKDVVDSHVHIYPSNRAGFWRVSSGAEDLIASMDVSGIQNAMVIALEPYISNLELFKEIELYSDRLYLIGSVDPAKSKAVESVREAVKVYGARAIKLHPRLQKFGHSTINMIFPISKECEDLGIPLIICTFCGGFDLFQSKTIEMCLELAIKFPKLNIIMAHAGAHRPIDAMLAIKSCHNLHADLSFSPIYFQGSSVELDLKYLIRKTDPKKILFGSDFPEASQLNSLQWFEGVSKELRLKEEQINLILSGNAKRLFKIDDKG